MPAMCRARRSLLPCPPRSYAPRCCPLRCGLLLVLLLGALVPVLRPTPAAAQPAETSCSGSERFPIRICGVRAGDEQRAASLLQLAEKGWEAAVVELGLPQPWCLAAQGEPEPGLALELVDRAQGGALFEPLADVPQTPWADCAGRILVSRRARGSMQQLQLLYEVLGAVHDADDCAEPLEEFLPFALYPRLIAAAGLGTAEESLVWMNESYFATFQGNPDLALGYSTQSVAELTRYHFGQALFAMYLDQRWGDGDGKLLVEISRAGRQPGSVVVQPPQVQLQQGENEPDLYDAVETVLAMRGGSFWQAVEEFAVWRLFTGSFADGEHLAHAELLAEPTFAAQHSLAELPLAGKVAARSPQETGSVYLFVDLAAAQAAGEAGGSLEERAGQRLSFALRSVAGKSWAVAGLILQADGRHGRIVAGTGSGEARLLVDGLEQARSVVFVVTSLGDKVHDPDDHDWDCLPFRYDIRLVHQPRASGVEPSQVRRGARDTVLLVSGSGFEAGLAADLGSGIAVKQLVRDASGERLALVVDVAADAEVGWHALRLQDELGLGCSLERAVEVLPGPAPELSALEPPASPPGRRLAARLFGRGFLPEATLAVLGPPGVSVAELVYRDEQELLVELEIAATAPPGKRELQLTHPDGQHAMLAAGLVVLSPQADGGDGSAGGDGCHLVPGTGRADRVDPPAGAVALLLAASLLAGARSRWRGRPPAGDPPR
ncbi:MAG: hypothetical protein FJ125_01785 [Deltaproteobacteria bacterium]|nr:hypothetical protein [Deltaproteobacteria bacterium]